MFSIVDSMKKGFDIWKEARFAQLFTVIIIQFIAAFIITPFGFWIAINAAEGAVVLVADRSRFIYQTIYQSISLNPGFWLSTFATAVLGILIVTFTIGAVQQIAHKVDTGKGTPGVGDTLKDMAPLLLPLLVVTIVSALIIGIPTWLVAEIIDVTESTSESSIVSFSLFGGDNGLVELTGESIVGIIAIVLIVLVLTGPFLLSISAVVADGAGYNGIIDGWKLYIQKWKETIIAMVAVMVIGIIVAAILWIPINGLVNNADNDLSGIFGNVFLLMVIGIVAAFFVNNWLYSSMYRFYQDIKVAEPVKVEE